jgi:predicted peroxiredoxin
MVPLVASFLAKISLFLLTTPFSVHIFAMSKGQNLLTDKKTENKKKQNLQTSKHYNYETYQFIPRGTCLPPHIRHSLSR